MTKRIGVVGILVYEPAKDADKVNRILSEYAYLIVGRMGIPYKEKGVSVIALTVDGDNDLLGAMTGKLGQIESVTVKTALVSEKKSKREGED